MNIWEDRKDTHETGRQRQKERVLRLGKETDAEAGKLDPLGNKSKVSLAEAGFRSCGNDAFIWRMNHLKLLLNMQLWASGGQFEIPCTDKLNTCYVLGPKVGGEETELVSLSQGADSSGIQTDNS